MSEIVVTSRIFSATDQKRFAGCSGDVNPIHMDPIAARRTQAGVCVVHGVHVALWAMDALSKVGKMSASIATLKVQFKNFVPVGSEAALRVVGETGTILRAMVSIDDVAVMSLAIGGGSIAAADAALLSTTTVLLSDAPRLMSFSDIPGCAGWLPGTAEREIAHLFPHVAKLLGAGRVEAIARLSTLVGMVCPGLYSIFAGFDITMTAEADGITGLSFRVQSVDDRFRMADLAVIGHGIRGKVSALARPRPVAQHSLQSLVGRVAKHEFRGTTALTINHGWRVIAGQIWRDRRNYIRIMEPVGFLLTFLSVTAAMVFFRSTTLTSAIDLVKGIIGLNGIGLPQTLLDHLGPLAERLHAVGVAAEPWSIQDFAKTIIWIFFLMFVALACPNTLQILARYEPALGVTSQSAKLPTDSMIEWNASLPWAIAVSAVAAIAIVSVGGPSEFLYWQF